MRVERGFTLIEVLVAFVILALSLTVLLRIFSGGLRNVEVSSDYARAVLVAQAQLAAAGVSEPLELGETRGEWDQRFRWRRRVEPYVPGDVETPLPESVTAYHITVEVDWDNGTQQRHISLSSLRLSTAPPGIGRAG